tara:strand:+ start:181 stop:450 length:270 start_codon:yes stop_codon:yes gene_type:complete
METNLITATIQYFSKSKKTAFITASPNPFSMDSVAGYVRTTTILNQEPGSEFKIPTGFSLEPMTDEDGVPFTTKNGEVRMKFVWKACKS